MTFILSLFQRKGYTFIRRTNLYENFLTVADEKKEVNDGDLIMIATSMPVLSKMF
jgi:hypothetical protein